MESEILENNELIIKEYEDFVSQNEEIFPLEKENIFSKIQENYNIKIIKNNEIELDKETYYNKKEDDRQTFLEKMFNNSETLNNVFNQFKNTTDPIKITFDKNPESNIYDLLTKILWYNNFFKNDQLDISMIKHQLGKDVHRATTFFNDKEIDKKILSNIADEYKRADNFNLILMNLINDDNVDILIDPIYLIDLLRIQQVIGVLNDTVTHKMVKLDFTIGGEGSLIYTAILNSKEKYMKCEYSGKIISFIDPEIEGGSFKSCFNINITDLSYSFDVSIIFPNIEILQGQDEPQNEGQDESQIEGNGVIDYVKNNQSNVAIGVGSAALGATGATIGTLLLTGILGGNTKTLHNKRKNNKRKNKKTKKNKKNKKKK